MSVNSIRIARDTILSKVNTFDSKDLVLKNNPKHKDGFMRNLIRYCDGLVVTTKKCGKCFKVSYGDIEDYANGQDDVKITNARGYSTAKIKSENWMHIVKQGDSCIDRDLSEVNCMVLTKESDVYGFNVFSESRLTEIAPAEKSVMINKYSGLFDIVTSEYELDNLTVLKILLNGVDVLVVKSDTVEATEDFYRSCTPSDYTCSTIISRNGLIYRCFLSSFVFLRSIVNVNDPLFSFHDDNYAELEFIDDSKTVKAIDKRAFKSRCNTFNTINKFIKYIKSVSRRAIKSYENHGIEKAIYNGMVESQTIISKIASIVKAAHGNQVPSGVVSHSAAFNRTSTSLIEIAGCAPCEICGTNMSVFDFRINSSSVSGSINLTSITTSLIRALSGLVKTINMRDMIKSSPFNVGEMRLFALQAPRAFRKPSDCYSFKRKLYEHDSSSDDRRYMINTMSPNCIRRNNTKKILDSSVCLYNIHKGLYITATGSLQDGYRSNACAVIRSVCFIVDLNKGGPDPMFVLGIPNRFVLSKSSLRVSRGKERGALKGLLNLMLNSVRHYANIPQANVDQMIFNCGVKANKKNAILIKDPGTGRLELRIWYDRSDGWIINIGRTVADSIYASIALAPKPIKPASFGHLPLCLRSKKNRDFYVNIKNIDNNQLTRIDVIGKDDLDRALDAGIKIFKYDLSGGFKIKVKDIFKEHEKCLKY